MTSLLIKFARENYFAISTLLVCLAYSTCIFITPFDANSELPYLPIIYLLALYFLPFALSISLRRLTAIAYGAITAAILIITYALIIDSELVFVKHLEARRFLYHGFLPRLFTPESEAQERLMLHVAKLESRFLFLYSYSAFVIFSGFVFGIITEGLLLHKRMGVFARLAVGAGSILLMLINFTFFLAFYAAILDSELDSNCDYVAFALAHGMILLISAILILAYAYGNGRSGRDT